MALRETSCDAVMSAEGILSNPALFSGLQPPAADEARAYFSHFEKSRGGANISSLKTFLFRIWRVGLLKQPELRFKLDLLGKLEEFTEWNEQMAQKSNQVCQPYIRDSKEVMGYSKEKLSQYEIDQRENEKRMRRDERKLEHKKQRLEAKKLAKKLKSEKTEASTSTKNQGEIRKQGLERWKKADIKTHVTLCFDFSWESDFSDRDFRSLIQQLMRTFGRIRKDEKSAKIFLSSKSGRLKTELRQPNFDHCLHYPIEFLSESPENHFDPEKIIILTSDATEPLESIELGKIYVIGALLDKSSKEKAQKMLKKGKEFNIKCRRLPIPGNDFHKIIISSNRLNR